MSRQPSRCCRRDQIHGNSTRAVVRSGRLPPLASPMPKLSCPRCNVRIRATDAMLARPIFCPTCGSGLWQPAATPPVAVPVVEPPPVQVPPVAPVASHGQLEAPPVQATAPPPARPSPRVVFMKAERSRLPAHVAAAFGVGLLAFAGLGSIVVQNAGRKTTATSATKRPATSTWVQPDQPDRPPARPVPSVGPLKLPSPPSATDVKLAAAGRPALSRDGESWDLNRLFQHLEECGVGFEVTDRMRSTQPGVWFTRRGSSPVLVQQHADRTAAQLAAASPVSKGESQFAWGRFVVTGRPSELYRELRAALAP